MDVLEGLGFSRELLSEPLDGRCFVENEKIDLKDLLDRHALLVILDRLLEQENIVSREGNRCSRLA